MKRTTYLETEEYKCTLGIGSHETYYGDIYSYIEGHWYHWSTNKQGNLIGECFTDGHYYTFEL